MPALFLLDVATDNPARRATLRLSDEHGIHLAAHEVTLDAHTPATWDGLFGFGLGVASQLDLSDERPPAPVTRG